MNRNLRWRLVLTVLLGLPLIFYGIPYGLRPVGKESRSLFQGIEYRREVRSRPRSLVIHQVTIDLMAPGIGVLVTPGNVTPDNTETNARTTSEFLRAFKLQLAINANFFGIFGRRHLGIIFPRAAIALIPLDSRFLTALPILRLNPLGPHYAFQWITMPGLRKVEIVLPKRSKLWLEVRC